ncbi:MAG TPA: PepSY-associated TM helix domain-containing protein [Rhodanobacter sp.]|nr:PepSY-associated TM helix domain-containing protein [Rhodanobacter sp.]
MGQPQSPVESLQPRRRAFWMRQLHQWHWVSSALCLIGLLLFALTGINLNHARQIEAAPRVSHQTLILPPPLRAAIAGDDEHKRHAAHDFFYREEIERWLAQGRTERADFAWSRDQAERIHVQQRLREANDELLAWLEADAAVYV